MEIRSPAGVRRLTAWALALSALATGCDYRREKHVQETTTPAGPPPVNQPAFTTLENGLFLVDCMPCHSASQASSNGNVTLDSYSGLKSSTGLTGPALTPGSSAL